jgi:hypothetical protein
MAPEITLSLTAAGALMTAQQVRPFRRALASRHYVRAEGKVLAAGVRGLDDGVPEIKTAVPLVRYEYHAGGAWRRGDVVHWNGFGFHEAVRTALRYEAGQRVGVWYDPARPDRAVLEPGVSLGSGFRVVAAVGVLAAELAWTAALLMNGRDDR